MFYTCFMCVYMRLYVFYMRLYAFKFGLPEFEPELSSNLQFQLRHHCIPPSLISVKVVNMYFAFGIHHLASHPGLPSTPLDAYRKMSMDPAIFRLNYGMRGELCPKPFEKLLNLEIPRILNILLWSIDFVFSGCLTCWVLGHVFRRVGTILGDS